MINDCLHLTGDLQVLTHIKSVCVTCHTQHGDQVTTGRFPPSPKAIGIEAIFLGIRP